ncbi:MAG: Trehalose and maltose hydrolase (possible phosphorylase) [Chloroflexi bacterium AL-W]|nr:Trehalose and maltose hydrolase (possible phosphorylase) [Chloroflexi bacterium AL-N1]NOK67850.1 Trehalose and maltose hydrolase (possible phosphorylase) [Chloroflexi bacterium AL-N10]NOK75381.1 Trehalose and maltose hydrolase (possible phosphorylase) [Chloroflexi bacterium AL-N5]NOK82169.1 Trehalose and maltose hydrolase (possible phosphorylase) [Chloroflexi bacterium AL-W]NOK90014.1 Trehalose and maltose hydrolase (possible phosphorylase) [Chloroflexi bacterium AL-N15]
MSDCTRFQLSEDPNWRLQIDGFDPAFESAVEAVLAMVNGYMGVRAAVEEGHTAAYPATFVAGIYNVPDKPQAVELEVPVSELVIAPDLAPVRIMVDGQDLQIGQTELLEMRRVLDLRQGVLFREWRLRDVSDRSTMLSSVRFVSLANRHAYLHLLTITPENYSGAITLESRVNGRVTNANNTVHLSTTSAREIDQGSLLAVQTRQSKYEIAVAAHAELRNSTTNEAIRQGAAWHPTEDGVIGQRWEWQANQGETYELHKFVALHTSRDGATPAASAVKTLRQLISDGFDKNLALHQQAWESRWSACDAAIAGDAETQVQVRFALYQLIGAANPTDERISIGARALTGERYRGHIFWDTETFVWPTYVFTHPQTARSLLLYRYHTLDGARQKAQDQGYQGALYPWEATDTGEETCPEFMLSGGSERVPVLTLREEHHLSADIAYAVWQYRDATGDNDFFFNYGAEMLLELARFWSNRVMVDESGQYHILKVIGPDEYHESVDDNAYTNYMAQWTIHRGLETVAELQRDAPERWESLAQRLDLGADELAMWQQVAEGLVVGFDPQTKLIEQFRGYHDLEEIDLSDHDSGEMTIDGKLGWYGMQKTKVLKQADVVMLLFLLWEHFPHDVHEANFRYYEPKTAHDSSLSPGFHALFAARLNDPSMALRYLRQSALVDLDFTRRGHASTAGGIHIATMGSIWQALAFGFLGMHPQPDGLRFRPHIPDAWGSLRMPLHWRGSHLHVTAYAELARVEIVVVAGESVQVAVGEGDWQTVAVGETYTGALT